MAMTHESVTLPREELEALRRVAPNDARIMQLFVAGWLAQLVDLASVDGPLTPPVEVVVLSDDDGNWLPQFRIRLASGLVMEIRVDQAPVGAQFVETLRHGLHGAERSICPGCGDELMRVAMVDLAYVFDTCTCGDPAYAHLVEQLWHIACFRDGRAETGGRP